MKPLRTNGVLTLILACVVGLAGCMSARDDTLSTGDSTVPSPEPIIAAQARAAADVQPVKLHGREGSGRSRPAAPSVHYSPPLVPRSAPPAGTFEGVGENPFKKVPQEPLSTFSIDVDTASYSIARRLLNNGTLPPKDAIRIEELVNYFDYAYPQPSADAPFSIHTEVATCPWKPKHRLLRVGLKGKEIEAGERPDSNLVFLLDVSGSMDAPNKLPLLKTAMTLLVDKLGPGDRVAIVVYAGASGLVLDSTACSERSKGTILKALDQLRAGGSTHGSAGLRQAYRVAEKNFIKRGVNRVILATDGDFNVGITDRNKLVRLIEDKAGTGVFLTVLGFGMGSYNYKDANLEQLADKGNGNYGYIDTINEARRMLVQQMEGTLITIAKDVKIQVEFNPAVVQRYRLVGYENRMLAAKDFNDDTKDAGEIGAGHTVTALYEVVPVGLVDEEDVDPLKYQAPTELSEQAGSGEMATVKLRYKEPDGDESKLLTVAVSDKGRSLRDASPDFTFSAAVAEFGMLLRDSEHKGKANYDRVLRLAKRGTGQDANGYREEFIELAGKARECAGR